VNLCLYKVVDYEVDPCSSLSKINLLKSNENVVKISNHLTWTLTPNSKFDQGELFNGNFMLIPLGCSMSKLTYGLQYKKIYRHDYVSLSIDEISN